MNRSLLHTRADLVQSGILLVFQAARVHHWLTYSFSSTRTPSLFLQDSCQWVLLPVCTHLGLTQLKHDTLHFALLNLIKLMWARFLSLFRSLSMASFPSIVSTAPPSLVLSANLLMRVKVASETIVADFYSQNWNAMQPKVMQVNCTCDLLYEDSNRPEISHSLQTAVLQSLNSLNNVLKSQIITKW